MEPNYKDVDEILDFDAPDFYLVSWKAIGQDISWIHEQHFDGSPKETIESLTYVKQVRSHLNEVAAKQRRVRRRGHSRSTLPRSLTAIPTGSFSSSSDGTPIAVKNGSRRLLVTSQVEHVESSDSEEGVIGSGGVAGTRTGRERERERGECGETATTKDDGTHNQLSQFSSNQHQACRRRSQEVYTYLPPKKVRKKTDKIQKAYKQYTSLTPTASRRGGDVDDGGRSDRRGSEATPQQPQPQPPSTPSPGGGAASPHQTQHLSHSTHLNSRSNVTAVTVPLDPKRRKKNK